MTRALPMLFLLGCFPKPPGSGDIVLDDTYNYSFTIDIELDPYELQELADHVGDWSGLTQDMRGNPIDNLDDIQYATLANYQGSVDELQAQIIAGTLTTNSFESPWEATVKPGTRSLAMSDFTLSGTRFDPADPALGFEVSPDSTWVWTLWRFNEYLNADEIVSTAALLPSAKSTEVDFSFTSTSASVTTFSADLTSIASAVVQGSQEPSAYTADWSGVTTDAMGAPFDDLLATELFIAHLSSASAPADVEDSLLTDLYGADTWTLSVYGVRTAALAQAYSTVSDTYFPGFTAGGVWVLGILDPSGQQPAPYLMTVVTVE